MICIFPTGKFQPHMGRSISINQFWFYQPNQTSQQQTTLRSKIKLQRTVIKNNLGHKSTRKSAFEKNYWPYIA